MTLSLQRTFGHLLAEHGLFHQLSRVQNATHWRTKQISNVVAGSFSDFWPSPHGFACSLDLDSEMFSWHDAVHFICPTITQVL